MYEAQPDGERVTLGANPISPRAAENQVGVRLMVVIAHPTIDKRLEALGTAPAPFWRLPGWRRHVVAQEFVH